MAFKHSATKLGGNSLLQFRASQILSFGISVHILDINTLYLEYTVPYKISNQQKFITNDVLVLTLLINHSIIL